MLVYRDLQQGGWRNRRSKYTDSCGGKRTQDQAATFLRELAKEYGADNPDELATELLILIDGAITVALVMGNKEAARDAKEIARKLMRP